MSRLFACHEGAANRRKEDCRGASGFPPAGM